MRYFKQEAYCKNTSGEKSGWMREDWQRGVPHKADALLRSEIGYSV